MQISYPAKVADLLQNTDKYHDQFYRKVRFGGPSLHFHQRSLATWIQTDTTPCLELIYAMLTSWGMHRMGKSGSKMKSFSDFMASISPLTADIVAARSYSYSTMTAQDWALIEKIFKSIKVMRSQTTLVGNSKVMAHLMPNIIPPVDRQYTLKFLKGSGTIKNNLNGEWILLKEIIEQLFIPTAKDPVFAGKAAGWLKNSAAFPWDTSTFKIIDNLIIGAM